MRLKIEAGVIALKLSIPPPSPSVQDSTNSPLTFMTKNYESESSPGSKIIKLILPLQNCCKITASF